MHGSSDNPMVMLWQWQWQWQAKIESKKWVFRNWGIGNTKVTGWVEGKGRGWVFVGLRWELRE